MDPVDDIPKEEFTLTQRVPISARFLMLLVVLTSFFTNAALAQVTNTDELASAAEQRRTIQSSSVPHAPFSLTSRPSSDVSNAQLTSGFGGSPGFLPTVTYRTGGSESGFVTTADVNGDGFSDLLVANTYYSNTIGVGLGKGDGTFRSIVRYPSGGGFPVTIVPVDVNGDGKVDLVISNQTPCYACSGDGLVAVLLGKGNGTFEPPVSYDAGGFGYASLGPSQMTVVDLNGDGTLDVIVANCAPRRTIGCGEDNGVLGVLLGNGNGTFQAVRTFNVGGFSGESGLAVADVNADGKLDALVTTGCVSSTNCSHGGVRVLLGRGDGTFKSSVAYATAGHSATGIAVADVNGDGKLDAIVGGCSTNDCWAANGLVSVLLGIGNGAFRPAVGFDSGGRLADGLAVRDMDGDGKLDVVTADTIDNSVAVLLGNGNGSFQAAQTFSAGGELTYSISIADIDGDGKPDVLASNCGSGGGCGGSILGAVGVLLSYGPRSTTLLHTSGSPALVSEAVTFSAQVTSDSGPVPDGDVVRFYDGSKLLKSVTTSGGSAQFSTTSLAAGIHSIEALYFGHLPLKRSSAVITQTVKKYATTTALTSSLNPAQSGQPVTFAAHVSSSGPQPTGTVNFFDDGIRLGSAVLNDGSAQLTESSLGVGNHSLVAVYVGDGKSAKSTSAALTETVQ